MSHKACEFVYFSLVHLSFVSLSYRVPTGEPWKVEGEKPLSVSLPHTRQEGGSFPEVMMRK